MERKWTPENHRAENTAKTTNQGKRLRNIDTKQSPIPTLKAVLIRILCTCVFLISDLSLFAQDSSYFTLKVYQKKKEININHDHVVNLKKAKFDLVFVMNQPTDFLINASYSSASFEQAKSGTELHKIAGFQETGMAEGLRNEDLEIFINDSAPNAWFYEDEINHRFNKIRKDGDLLVCTRTIEYIRDMNLNRRDKIKKTESPMYLVIVVYRYDMQLRRSIEKQRYLLQINFQ